MIFLSIPPSLSISFHSSFELFYDIVFVSVRCPSHGHLVIFHVCLDSFSIRLRVVPYAFRVSTMACDCERRQIHNWIVSFHFYAQIGINYNK